MAEGEGAVDEEGKKKGGKKKLIIMIVGIVLIALVAAKMTVLKPPPVTAAQAAAKAREEHYVLETKCALANSLPAPAPPKTDAKKGEGGEKPPTTTTTIPEEATPVMGPVLEIDSKTLNLADGHFLKIGLAVQLAPGAVPDDIGKTENWGSLTSQVVLNAFAGSDMDSLLPAKNREAIRHAVGKEICMQSEGKATTVYFTEFVAQ